MSQEDDSRRSLFDTATFTSLFEDLFPELSRYGYGKGISFQEAEQLAQDAFELFLNAIINGAYEERGMAKAYVYRIFNNLFIDRYRKQKAVKLVSYEGLVASCEKNQVSDDDTEEQALGSVLIQQAVAMIDSLTEKQKEALLLHLQNLPPDELESALKEQRVRINTHRVRVTRAKQKLLRIVR